MAGKRFATNRYYIYDHFKEDSWLVNEVEAQEIVDIMNNLDIKARENSKALSTLQKKYNALHEENQQLKEDIDELDKKSDELHDEKIRLIRDNTRLKKKLKEHNDMLEWHQGGW